MALIQQDETWRMEDYGEAYVRAVASVAGCGVDRPRVDNDSIDLTFSRRASSGRLRGLRLEAQLKTTGAEVLGATDVAFPLPMKNYDDLRHPMVLVPRILIVVVVPADSADWMTQGESELCLKKCAYWMSLRDMPAVANVSTRTVRVPRSQVFSPTALESILDRIANGGQP
jgi:hypothetical protein